MTDRHLRILGLMAHQRQRELRNYEAVDHGDEAASTDRRKTSSERQRGPARVWQTPKPGGANLGQVERPDHHPRAVVALYQHGQLRPQIEALRSAQAAVAARLPVRQRTSDASLRARLRAALDEGQCQREEIARLREELALAHGRVRELELDRRLRGT